MKRSFRKELKLTSKPYILKTPQRDVKLYWEEKEYEIFLRKF